MRLSLVDRYLLRETAQTWAAVTLVLLVILVSNRFALLLGDAAAGTLAAGSVFALIGLAALNYLVIIIPVGLFFGIMLALGRLYRDSEMTAMMACGIGSWNIYRPVMLFTGLLVVVLAVLALNVSPWAAASSDAVRARGEHEAEFTHFEAGRFKSPGNNGGVFYAEAVDSDGRLHHVFAETHTGGEVQIVSAASGVQAPAPDGNGRFLILTDGYRYQGVPGTAGFRVARFKHYGVRIAPGASGYSQGTDTAAQPTAALWSMPTAEARAEIEWRIAMPVSALVLAFLAVPLARTHPRQGRYGKLFAAVLVYIIYSNVLAVARVWVEREWIPGPVGLWWVPAVTVVLALVLLWRQRELRRYSPLEGATPA
ncbi:MAG TPA: LPS export ABC transporter permease LptF [Gammaproteobacteria bacterium]|nr:LPS export ABC transporter permease LptF [Gammaproteobacteria bacterium]